MTCACQIQRPIVHGEVAGGVPESGQSGLEAIQQGAQAVKEAAMPYVAQGAQAAKEVVEQGKKVVRENVSPEQRSSSLYWTLAIVAGAIGVVLGVFPRTVSLCAW
jgi:ABC-type branched-subunit amino acid transport system substrate-binding protein